MAEADVNGKVLSEIQMPFPGLGALIGNTNNSTKNNPVQPAVSTPKSPHGTLRNVEFIEFVETEDKLRSFQCRHCGQVAISYVQLHCGHILCQECFPTFHLKRCPAKDCHEDVENTVFDTNCLDNEISELKVFCKYHKRGCGVVLSLLDLLSHERKCVFSKLTNENIEDLTKCKEDIRNLKRQFVEFQVQLQPIMTLFTDKSLIQNNEIENVILEKVKIESAKERMKLERKLTENVEKYIDNKMEILESKTETKLLSKYEKDFKNLQEKVLKEMKENSDFIEKSVKNETSKKLKDDVENLKKELKRDLLTQNDEIKKKLQEVSKTFIEGVVELKCREIEKKSFNNLIVKCQKYSEGIKKDLNRDLEMKLKENVENERNILLNELKNEVNLKGNEIEMNAIHELSEELKKHTETLQCTLEKSLNENNESNQLKMEDTLKKQITSEIYCDIKSFSKRLDVLLPRSFNFTWEIEDFQDQLSKDELSFESDVFHLNEFGCKVKFIFHLYPKMCFEVKYVDRPSDKDFPFNGHQRITFILHDQVDNKSHKDFIIIFEPTFGDWTNQTLFWYRTTKDQLSFLHSRWLKNGTIQVKVQMEPFDHIIALEPRHYGHIIWKIDHFKDVRESYRYERQCSLSKAFYSSEKGYRLKGRLFVGDKVYFTLFFLKGPFDKELPKIFKHRTTISLISQKDQIELKDKTISKNSESTSYDAVHYHFTKADLQKYVKDDSLMISLKVETF